MKASLLMLLFIFLAVGLCLGESSKSLSTIEQLKEDPTSQLVIQAIPEASEIKDRALTTFVARRIARNFPFSPAAIKLLEAARAQSPELLQNFKGGDFWFLPMGFIRILVLVSGLLMVFRFELRSFKTFLFLSLAFGLIIGEGMNLSRGLFTTAFIPFEGEHYSLSAPEKSSQAVERLTPGTEITVSEISGDWIKLEMPSGRVGWVLSEDGILESEGI